MGFLDNVTSAVNRGTAAAGRGADKIKLNARIAELNRQRQGLAAQLGASLYEATRDDATFVAGREGLYEGIARVDAEREDCSGCGTPADKARAQAAPAPIAPSGPACASCGAPLGEGDMFCMACGAKVASAASADTGVGEAELAENAGVGEADLVEAGSGDTPKGGE